MRWYYNHALAFASAHSPVKSMKITLNQRQERVKNKINQNDEKKTYTRKMQQERERETNSCFYSNCFMSFCTNKFNCVSLSFLLKLTSGEKNNMLENNWKRERELCFSCGHCPFFLHHSHICVLGWISWAVSRLEKKSLPLCYANWPTFRRNINFYRQHLGILNHPSVHAL